jgi:putative flippase GtrA
MMSAGRIARYVLAGGGSLALDLALQWMLLGVAGLPVWLGSALSYELALLAHFVVVNGWVFGQRDFRVRRLIEFQGAALTAQVVTLGITYLLVYGPASPWFATGFGPYLAKIAGTATAFIWTFLASFLWIWRPRSPQPPDPAEGRLPVDGVVASWSPPPRPEPREL